MTGRLMNTALEIANDLHETGAIDAFIMREYESLALEPVAKLNPEKIKHLLGSGG